jgi:hypothetical protein
MFFQSPLFHYAKIAFHNVKMENQRLQAGKNHTRSRFLPEDTSLFPFFGAERPGVDSRQRYHWLPAPRLTQV